MVWLVIIAVFLAEWFAIRLVLFLASFQIT